MVDLLRPLMNDLIRPVMFELFKPLERNDFNYVPCEDGSLKVFVEFEACEIRYENARYRVYWPGSKRHTHSSPSIDQTIHYLSRIRELIKIKSLVHHYNQTLYPNCWFKTNIYGLTINISLSGSEVGIGAVLLNTGYRVFHCGELCYRFPLPKCKKETITEDICELMRLMIEHHPEVRAALIAEENVLVTEAEMLELVSTIIEQRNELLMRSC